MPKQYSADEFFADMQPANNVPSADQFFSDLSPGTGQQTSGPIPTAQTFKQFLPTKEQIPELVGSMAGGLMRKTPAGMAVAAGGAAVGEGVRQAIFEKQPLTMGERAMKLGGAALRGGLGEGLGRGVGMVARNLFDPFAKSVTPEIKAQMAAAARAGVEPPLSAMTESPRVQAIERAAEFSPWGGSQVTAKKQLAIKQLEDFTNKISDNISPDNPPEFVGELATKKVKQFEQTFKKAKDALYEPIMAKLKDVPINATNTIAMIKDVIEQKAGGNEGQALLKNWLKRLTPIPATEKVVSEGVPGMATPSIVEKTSEIMPGFKVLKAIRTEIGSRGNFNDPGVTGLKAQLERIYAAASKDLDAAASQHGMADAINAADAMYAKGIRKLQDSLIKAINTRSQKSPESLYKLLIRNDSPTLIKTGREILGQDGFNQIRKQWFDNLVEKSKSIIEGEEVISPPKLANNLRRMGSSLNEIFSDNAQMQKMVSDLSDVSKMLTRGNKVTKGSQTSFIGKDTLVALRGLISAALTNTETGRKFLMSGFPQFGRQVGKVAARVVQPVSQVGMQNLVDEDQ